MIYKVRSREKITALSSAIGFTAAKIAATEDISYALVQALDQAVRICYNGDTPTASVGQRLAVNDWIEIWGQGALNNFLAIEEAASAVLEVSYFGK